MSDNKKSNLRGVIRNSARMYFAPLVAAIDTIRSEIVGDGDIKAVNNRNITVCTRASVVISRTINNPGPVWMLQSKPSTTLVKSIEVSYSDRSIHQR